MMSMLIEWIDFRGTINNILKMIILTNAGQVYSPSMVNFRAGLRNVYVIQLGLMRNVSNFCDNRKVFSQEN